jgi:hypothetical protein
MTIEDLDARMALSGLAGPQGSAFSTEPGRDIGHPNSAPAYYQGRPARLWISAMRPRSRTASHHVMETVTRGRERTPSEHGLLAAAGSKLPA